MNVTRNKPLSKRWFPALVLGVAAYVLALGTSVAQGPVTVNCPAESINAALGGATPGTIITVNGICMENVTFPSGQDGVTLQGGPGGVTGIAPGVPAINIFAHGAVIDDLTVSGGAFDGIRVSNNGDVTVQNSTIESNAGSGVNAVNGGFAFIDNNTIRFNGECEVVTFDAGMARLTNNTIVSTQPDANICSALGVFRARMRLAGGNTVQNITATGFAIDVFNGATFRQSGGHDIVSGPVSIGAHSFADFRDVAITGNVDMFRGNSFLRMRDQGSVPNNVSVTGNINIGETNAANFRSGAQSPLISGNINCNSGTLFGSPTVLLPGTINCPAPLHVLRSNGTAQILVEETTAAVSPRNMFELRNNGPIGFNMTNSNLAQTWRFAAQTTGFRVSLDGSGGPELTVLNTGAVTMGPGAQTTFSLDPAGNLVIDGSATATAHVTASDRNLKENFVDLEGTQVLAKLSALPVTEWSFKGDPGRHIGPTAQDFKAAFGLGADDTHIASLDVASVAVVGVKQLHKMIAARDAEIAALKQRLAALEGMVSRVVAQQPMQTAQR